MTFVIDSHRFGGVNLLGNLVSWWALEETTGTRYDSHGTLDATDINTVDYTTGVQGNAADFTHGAQELLDIGDVAALKPSGSFSICSWVSLGTPTARSCEIMSKTRLADLGWLLLHVNSTGFRFSVSPDGTTAYTQVTSSGHASAATWYFVAAGYDHTNSEIWLKVDNETTLTQSFTGPVNGSDAHAYIGARADATVSDAALWMEGLIDEVGFWSRRLTEAELAALYNSGSGITYADI